MEKKKKKIIGITTGKKFVDEFLEQYEGISIDKLGSVYSEIGQAKTVLIRWMMKNSKTSLNRLANYLGCNVQSLRNKMVRDSFSFEDLVICAHACKCSIQIKSNTSTGKDNILTITPSDFFKVSDLGKPSEEQVLKRLEMLDNENIAEKAAEYNKLKKELERMKAEYGFE